MTRDIIIYCAIIAFTVAFAVLTALLYLRKPRHTVPELPPPWEHEPGAFTEEELQRLYELKRRYVAEEVQP